MLELEIVTPERIAYSDKVDMIIVPSLDGQIGVLPHHVPLFSRLTEGELKIVKGEEEIYLAIGGGFMEVTASKVMILVTEAYHAHEINEQDVLSARKRAEEALKEKGHPDGLIQAQALFKRSTIALKVLSRRKRSSVVH